MKTFMAKPGEIEQRWWLVDASDKIVGRLASDIAMVLMGKHRPTYTPHVDTGDFVVVINAEKVQFTGKKWQQKEYRWYTGYNGLKSETAEHRLNRRPELILEEAVRRMLPASPRSPGPTLRTPQRQRVDRLPQTGADSGQEATMAHNGRDRTFFICPEGLEASWAANFATTPKPNFTTEPHRLFVEDLLFLHARWGQSPPGKKP